MDNLVLGIHSGEEIILYDQLRPRKKILARINITLPSTCVQHSHRICISADPSVGVRREKKTHLVE